MASLVGRAVNRYISSTVPLTAATGHAATAGGHGGGYLLWKKLTFFLAFPAIGVTMLHCYLKHQEHEERPEFRAYEHMRIRRKRFPWGDGQKSFFHNPHANALPEGYEDGH